MALEFYAEIAGFHGAKTPRISGETTDHLYWEAWQQCIGSDHVSRIMAVLDGNRTRPVVVYTELGGWQIADPVTENAVRALSAT